MERDPAVTIIDDFSFRDFANIVYLNHLDKENTFTRAHAQATFKEFFQNVCISDAYNEIEAKDMPFRDHLKGLPENYFDDEFLEAEMQSVLVSISDFLEKANLIGERASEKLFPGVNSANAVAHAPEERELGLWMADLVEMGIPISPKPSFDALSSIAGIPRKLANSELFAGLFDESREQDLSVKF